MKKRKLWVVRCVVLLAAVLCIGIGVIRGEHKDVEKKATNICLQCIGIG